MQKILTAPLVPHAVSFLRHLLSRITTSNTKLNYQGSDKETETRSVHIQSLLSGADMPFMESHTRGNAERTALIDKEDSLMWNCAFSTPNMGAHTPSMGAIAAVGRLPSGVTHDGSASDRSARHTEPGNWRARYYLDSDVQQLGWGGGCEDVARGGAGESEDDLLAHDAHGIALSSLPDVPGPVEPRAFAAGDIRGGIVMQLDSVGSICNSLLSGLPSLLRGRGGDETRVAQVAAATPLAVC